MKGKIILGSLIVLFLALAVPNVSATYDVCTGCHPSYVNAIRASGHANSDNCINCHKASYDTSDHQDSTPYIGYNVTEATCNTSFCHSSTSGQRPVNESHGNKYYGPNKADCTQCHFANTTKTFTGYNTSLYTHDHNLTVEYNFYNYNLSGMPLSTNGGVGKGMFPYYTCTLTCHSTYKIENEVIGWNESKHARSREGTSDSNAYCAKCKSPTQYNTSADTTYNGSANRSEFPIAESNWQGIQCRICHNLHNDTYSGASAPAFPLAYYNPLLSYNASRPVYDQVSDATVLCQKCHSNRNFAGVHKDTVGFDCANCHANSTYSDRTHNFEVKNTTSGVTGCEVCHDSADHTWQYTSRHTGKVICEACHDQTVSRNATGYALTSGSTKYGVYNDTATGLVSNYKESHGTPATWSLHNISKAVSCNKCHGTKSNATDQLIAPGGGTVGACASCHSSYNTAYNNSEHNATLNGGAPGCTGCHTAYDTNFDVPSNNHTSRAIVNRTTCINCHVEGENGFNFSHKNATYVDCTRCHFANTTTPFALNASYYTTDHNLTVVHNYYYYNQSGTVRMPLKSNGGVGEGMFPYWTCSKYCHGSSNPLPSMDNASFTWINSKHAQSLVEPPADQKISCAKCKSPVNYNVSATNMSALVPESDWQGIQCRVCHNIHYPRYSNTSGGFPLAFYNGTASSLAKYSVYDQVHNATELCEKCHTGSSHDSKFAGFHKDTLGFDCASCHLNTTSFANGGFNNKSHMFEVTNVYTGVTGCEVCHNPADHAFQWTSTHTGKVTCEACHDKTVSKNATGYAMSSDGKYGVYNDTATGLVSSFKDSHGTPATWPLHNISKDVSCDKCHGTKSYATNLDIAPAFGTGTGCAQCHTSYIDAVNSSMHNKTINPAAPSYCTDCHTGYDTQHSGLIVNESNTCRTCHVQNVNLNESHGNNNYGQNYTNCTQCHFANTTRKFTGFNDSLYIHDHNLTVEYNFYNYNLYGMPLSTNGGAGKGMFPYYTCTITCHNGTGGGQPKIENETVAWNQSGHAQASSHGSTYNRTCLKCHSPPMYNESNTASFATSVVQGIQCRVCHNLHNDTYSGNGTPPINIAFYNATLSSSAGLPVYETVVTATELCEKCHKGGYHNTSRDIYYSGSHKTSLGFTCASCHMNSTINNGSEHTFEVKNSTSGLTGCEACHVAASVHTGTSFTLYSSHLNVTCDACHDDTFVRNSSDFVVNVSTGKVSGGVYKNPSTNKWTTYRGTSTAWVFHNISNNVSCDKCHGALSVISGAIASNLTTGGITYYTTDALFVGYNFIVPWLYPEPTIYANYLISSSLSGVTGVNKTLNWNSTAQKWEGYEYIDGVYYGTNFTVVGKTPYFVSSSSAGKTYTFKGRK